MRTDHSGGDTAVPCDPVAVFMMELINKPAVRMPRMLSKLSGKNFMVQLPHRLKFLIRLRHFDQKFTHDLPLFPPMISANAASDGSVSAFPRRKRPA